MTEAPQLHRSEFLKLLAKYMETLKQDGEDAAGKLIDHLSVPEPQRHLASGYGFEPQVFVAS